MHVLIRQYTEKNIAVIIDDTIEPARSIIVSPAQNITTERVNWLFSVTGGLPFVAISHERSEAFMLSAMSRPKVSNQAVYNSEMRQLLSVEAREGVTTGISANDRAITIGILGEHNPNPRKLVRPGHIFPVEVRSGGVLVRPALPEAAYDLTMISGSSSAALYLDLLNKNGEFASLNEAQELSRSNKLPTLTLSEIIRYRLESESLVERVAEASLPTKMAGELRSIIYRTKLETSEHLALIKGDLTTNTPVLTRVQPEDTFSDVFGGPANASKQIINRAMSAIGDRGRGVMVYLRKSNSTLNTTNGNNKDGRLPPSAMMREYGLGAQILRDLGVKQIELLTGSKKNLVGLKTFGIEIVAQHPIPNNAHDN